MTATQSFIHELAIVEPGAEIGPGSRVWAYAHIRRGARVGGDCVIGSGATVDVDVKLGDRCKVQNHALLYRGVELQEGVFIGPAAVLTNDRVPRAVRADGEQLGDTDWHPAPIVVRRGAAIGANATLVAGISVGEWAMVAAGSVVTRDVEPHALVAGVPSRRIGWVCACGARVEAPGLLSCRSCRAT